MKKYCMYCMKPIGRDEGKCPFCGKSQSVASKEDHLQPGTVLHQKFYVGAVIARDGLSITYVGRDTRRDVRVTIREYFPQGFAVRSSMESGVVEENAGGKEGKLYERGLERFLKEGEMLKGSEGKIGIAQVWDVFGENNTGYIVTDCPDGEVLPKYLSGREPILPDYVINGKLPVQKKRRSSALLPALGIALVLYLISMLAFFGLRGNFGGDGETTAAVAENETATVVNSENETTSAAAAESETTDEAETVETETLESETLSATESADKRRVVSTDDSSNLLDYTVVICGETYQFPCDVQDFKDNGWTFTDTTLAAGETTVISVEYEIDEELETTTTGELKVTYNWPYTNWTTLNLYIYNPGTEKAPISECVAYGMNNIDYLRPTTDIVLSTGLTYYDDETRISDLYGTPSEYGNEYVLTYACIFYTYYEDPGAEDRDNHMVEICCMNSRVTMLCVKNLVE